MFTLKVSHFLPSHKKIQSLSSAFGWRSVSSPQAINQCTPIEIKIIRIIKETKMKSKFLWNMSFLNSFYKIEAPYMCHISQQCHICAFGFAHRHTHNLIIFNNIKPYTFIVSNDVRTCQWTGYILAGFWVHPTHFSRKRTEMKKVKWGYGILE